MAHAYARVIASPACFPLWLGHLLFSLGDTLHYIALVVLVLGVGPFSRLPRTARPEHVA